MDGFLTRTISRVRRHANEPATNAKYSSANILDELSPVYKSIFGELARVSPMPITVSFDITPVEAQTHYQLPPHIGTIRLMEYVDTAGNSAGILYPRAFRNIGGAGLIINQNILQFTGISAPTGHTIRIHYTPDGCAMLHEGSIDASSAIDSSETYYDEVVLASSPSTGTLDTRANAYAGCTYRVLSDTGGAGAKDYVQDRLISVHTNTTRTVRTYTKFDPTPGGTTHLYEIAPPLDTALDGIIAVGIARRMVSAEGDTRAYTHLTQMYREQLRELRLTAANLTSWTAGSVPSDSMLNRRAW